MVDPLATAWPRPYFKPGELATKIFFVCFARAPLSDQRLELARFGLPSSELLGQVDVREHRRADAPEWFEGWWRGSFGVIAERDLGQAATALTASDFCVTLGLELADRADLAPLQTAWGLTRWLCARGAAVVLDVHAFRYRTRPEVEALDLGRPDVQRDVKLVLETDATRDGLHLLHTRGLCKFARPELMCFIRPDDAGPIARFVDQIARTLMEGALAPQIRLRVADGVELVTRAADERALIQSLGIEAAVMIERADGAALAGIARHIPVA